MRQKELDDRANRAIQIRAVITKNKGKTKYVWTGRESWPFAKQIEFPKQ